ncbi:MAG: hypothetical protein U7M05_11730, partial [Candidatus Igneacidithiobacillus chanchocoensis]
MDDKLMAETGSPSRGQGVSPKAAALQGLPGEWRERLIAEASAMGIRADDDVAWLLVGSFVNAWAGAAAAGRAAAEVSKNVNAIPDQIYRGAVQASGEVQDAIAAKGAQIGQALSSAVSKSGDGVVQKIAATMTSHQHALNAAAADLVAKAEAAKSAIVSRGLSEFAEAAEQAVLSQMKEVTWRARVTGAIWGTLLLAGAAIGGVVFAMAD